MNILRRTLIYLFFIKIENVFLTKESIAGFGEYMRQSDRIRRMMHDPLGTIFGGLGLEDEDVLLHSEPELFLLSLP